MNIQSIPLTKIKLTSNTRSDYKGIDALAESMSKYGQKVEIRVFPVGDEFVLLSGYRRYKAAEQLGWSELRAVVEEAPEGALQQEIQQGLENLHRNDLSYIERANHYRILKDLGMRQVRIAHLYQVGEPEVSLAIRLLDAHPKLLAAVADGRISPSAVEPLMTRPMDVQEKLADKAVRLGTVRKVRTLLDAYDRNLEIQEQVEDRTDNSIPEEYDPVELMVLNDLERALVAIQMAAMTAFTHPVLQERADTALHGIYKILESQTLVTLVRPQILLAVSE